MRTIQDWIILLITGNTVMAQNPDGKFTPGHGLDSTINNSYAAYRANLTNGQDVVKIGFV